MGFYDQKCNVSGKCCIIFGSGPTLNSWDDSLYPDYVRLCCNTTIFSSNIKRCDYYFIQDNGCARPARGFHTIGENSYLGRKEEYDSFKPIYKKYYGAKVNDRVRKWNLKATDIVDGNAEGYNLYTTGNVIFNITNNLVREYGSVVFSMVQFAVGNGCDSILLVGCDCSSTRYNEPKPNATNINKLKKTWDGIKRQVGDNYGINILKYVPTK